MRTLPTTIKGVCMPCPDVADMATLASGVQNRIDRKLPRRRAGFLASLRASTLNFIKQRSINPIDISSDRGVESWLDRTNYNEARKAELRKVNDEIIYMLERVKRKGVSEFKHFVVKLFAKEEVYEGFKHARGIYARDDVAKVFFGPYFKLMEDEVYKMPEFIKHVPVAERPKYILDFVGGVECSYLTTDYSSFECHFSAEVMENCEFILYEHMLCGLPEGPLVMKVIRQVLAGINRIKCKGFTATIEATRMSGEMCTSLGNSFSNLMFMQNYCDHTNQKLCGVVEGDDGLFRFYGSQQFEILESNGLLLKMQSHEQLTTASFCGMIFDEDSMQPITNPYKALAKLGWSNRRYCRSGKHKLHMLQRAKLLSVLYQYPSCPILTEFCLFALRRNKATTAQAKRLVNQSVGFSVYEKEKIFEALNAVIETSVPTPATRDLFDHLYTISVEIQISVESRLRNDDESILRDRNFVHLFPPYCVDFYDFYTHNDKDWGISLGHGSML